MKNLACQFVLLMLFFASCKGQSANSIVAFDKNARIALGDTVASLGKHLMIVFQDRNKVYWFGSSSEGVYRYDEAHKTIVNYTTRDGLCHNKIVQIQEDDAGNIYFNTGNGISKFDGKTFTTLQAVNSPGNTWKLAPGDVWFKGAQDSGAVYRYDGKILYRLTFPPTKAGEEFKTMYPRDKFPAMIFNPYDIYTVYTDSKGNIWFGGSTLGVCRYNGKSVDWISEDDLTELDDGPANGVRAIIEDSEGYFWFSNTQYKYKVYDDAAGMQYTRKKNIGSLDGKKDGVLDFYLSAIKDRNGEVWIATYNAGVGRYNAAGEKVKQLKHYDIMRDGKQINLFSVYEDNTGNIWLGTHNDGVYTFRNEKFEQFIP